jgi:hypothetical protein
MTSGGAWKQVVSKTNWPAADTPAQLAFPVESTRQIRITGTGLKVMQFNEVEAYHLFPSPAVAAPANPLPSIVESRDHPGAEQILAQHGIRLFKGDGHIVFVTSRRFVDGVQCDVGQIQVDVVTPALPGVWYCFRTVGTSGYLTLEVPGTFLVRAGNQQLQAKARVASGETQTFPIPPNTPVEIDPGDGSEFPQAVLLELRLA